MESFNYDSINVEIPKRPSNSHKGDFGKVLVIGGSEGMGGAAILSSEASLFCGSGLVSLNTHPLNVEASLKRNPEVMALGVDSDIKIRNKVDVILCGPGMKSDAWSRKAYDTIYVQKNLKALILDAGALNFLSEKKITNFNNDMILTPHPGEAAKLLNISTSEIQKNRINAAKSISKIYHATVVLKGKDTIISSSNCKDIFVCSEGGSELSSGGTGDVLAGVISAIIAQKVNVIEACLLSVAVHARAGKIFHNDVGEIGLNASSLIPIIRKLLN